MHKDCLNRRWPDGIKRLIAKTRPLDPLPYGWRDVVPSVQYGADVCKRLRFSISTKHEPTGCVYTSYIFHPAREYGISKWRNKPRLWLNYRDRKGWQQFVGILSSLADKDSWELERLAGTFLAIISIGESFRDEEFGNYTAGIGIVAGKHNQNRLFVGELAPLRTKDGRPKYMVTPRGISLSLRSSDAIRQFAAGMEAVLNEMLLTDCTMEVTNGTKVIG